MQCSCNRHRRILHTIVRPQPEATQVLSRRVIDLPAYPTFSMHSTHFGYALGVWLAAAMSADPGLGEVDQLEPSIGVNGPLAVLSDSAQTYVVVAPRSKPIGRL